MAFVKPWDCPFCGEGSHIVGGDIVCQNCGTFLMPVATWNRRQPYLEPADLVCYRRDPRDVEGLVWFIQCKVSPTKADRDKIEGLVRSTGLTWRLM